MPGGGVWLVSSRGWSCRICCWKDPTTAGSVGIIYDVLNVAELALGGPQTANHASSGIAGKTQQPLLSSQSQQAQSQSSSSSLLSKDTLVLYLNVAKKICSGIRLQGGDVGRF